MGNNTNNPFNQISRTNSKISERASMPVGSLGDGLLRFNTNINPQQTTNIAAQTAQPVQAKPVNADIHVMASSPLPDKQMVSRIKTPDFSTGSPMSPVERRPVATTPLARQMFERNLKQQECQNLTMDNSAMSVDLDQEIKCWVSIFGFNSQNFDLVFK